MFRSVQKHLAWKVFLSYVIVILIGVLVLATATAFSAPAAFDRHLAGMGKMMTNGMMGASAQKLETDLFSSYQASVTEALSLAALAALMTAVAASFLISRQIVEPIQKMVTMSHRIAEGRYEERLNVSGNIEADQVDELGELALSFNQMADKLEKTEMIRRQLIGDVSHELRTPLTAIKGYMEGLIDGVLPADAATYQQIHAETIRLQRLVNDLQELSRMEGGAFHLDLQPVAVAALVAAVVSRLIHQYEEKGILLKSEIPDGIPTVYADKDRILQVLINLTGNALQYTLPGGTVRISAVRDKNEVVISVIDSGVGITSEHLPHIFDRFYRIDKSRTRSSGGSGIGLTIAKSLVMAHHGHIWVESQGKGKGSTFYFTLPVAP
jgi:two-component system sensor histidine kinase BaeS